MTIADKVRAYNTLVVVVLWLALFLLAGCASSTTGKALNVSLIGAGVADLVTTRQAIDSGRGVEANPLMGQSLTQQAIVKAAGISGVMALAAWSDAQGRPVLANVVRLIVTVAWTGIAIHNAQVPRR